MSVDPTPVKSQLGKLPRCYKAIAVSEQDVLNCFVEGSKFLPGESFTTTKLHFPNLPAGVRIQYACWDNLRQCYIFVLFHDSWPELGNGEAPPFLPGVREYVHVDAAGKIILVNKEVQDETDTRGWREKSPLF